MLPAFQSGKSQKAIPVPAVTWFSLAQRRRGAKGRKRAFSYWANAPCKFPRWCFDVRHDSDFLFALRLCVSARDIFLPALHEACF